MVRATGPTVVIRSPASQALACAMIVASVLGIVLALAAGNQALLAYAAPLVLFGLLGWAAFWHPHVEVSDGGVRVVNTWRTVQVPWTAVRGVDGRYGLRLDTSHGTVTSWAAPAPSGRARARQGRSAAAEVVNERLEELRAAGYLEDPQLERTALEAEWDVALVGAVALLVVASLLAFLG